MPLDVCCWVCVCVGQRCSQVIFCMSKSNFSVSAQVQVNSQVSGHKWKMSQTYQFDALTFSAAISEAENFLQTFIQTAQCNRGTTGPHWTYCAKEATVSHVITSPYRHFQPTFLWFGSCVKYSSALASVSWKQLTSIRGLTSSYAKQLTLTFMCSYCSAGSFRWCKQVFSCLPILL